MADQIAPQPFQYQGSKRGLAGRILSYFPSDLGTLYEPFAGSAAISLAAAAAGQAGKFAINDLNAPLAHLLQRIVEAPAELAERYERLWHEQGPNALTSVDHFNRVRSNFNTTHRPELLLYLLARCVKAAVRYNRDGMFNQSPDKRRRGTRPETMRRNIYATSALLRGKSRISALDYRDAIALAQPRDLIYMDPPYQGVSGERDARYISGLVFDDFVAGLNALNMRGLSYIVSFDGRLGERSYGKTLPASLELRRLELHAGRSSTATLLGRSDVTVESLYLSSALVERLSRARTGRGSTLPTSSDDLFAVATHDREAVAAVH